MKKILLLLILSLVSCKDHNEFIGQLEVSNEGTSHIEKIDIEKKSEFRENILSSLLTIKDKKNSYLEFTYSKNETPRELAGHTIKTTTKATVRLIYVTDSEDNLPHHIYMGEKDGDPIIKAKTTESLVRPILEKIDESISTMKGTG